MLQVLYALRYKKSAKKPAKKSASRLRGNRILLQYPAQIMLL